jgi:O-acetyl-ADP-ribose deacetylase (regulator of RNase III)
MTRGAAHAVASIAGPELEAEAKKTAKEMGGPLEPGSCFSTSPYKMHRRGVKRIYHAVTMKYPGGISNLEYVAKSFRAALAMVIKDKFKTVAVPALGCGDGRMDRDAVAGIMTPIARDVCHQISIKFIDTSEESINAFKRILGV